MFIVYSEKCQITSTCVRRVICIIYGMVGRSIANISDPRHHIYRGTKCRGKYAVEVGYIG